MNGPAIVIGVSTGGFRALGQVLPCLPKEFSAPIFIVQHLSSDSNDFLPEFLNGKCEIQVKQAEEKEQIRGGVAYLAPPNYHLLIERDFTLSLSIDERVNYARPSIDVLFETAAEAYGHQLIGVILTGANHDGAAGLKRIKSYGGKAIVQDPSTAEAPTMPESALAAVKADYVTSLGEIGPVLLTLVSDAGRKSTCERGPAK